MHGRVWEIAPLAMKKCCTAKRKINTEKCKIRFFFSFLAVCITDSFLYKQNHPIGTNFWTITFATWNYLQRQQVVWKKFYNTMHQNVNLFHTVCYNVLSTGILTADIPIFCYMETCTKYQLKLMMQQSPSDLEPLCRPH